MSNALIRHVDRVATFVAVALLTAVAFAGLAPGASAAAKTSTTIGGGAVAGTPLSKLTAPGAKATLTRTGLAIPPAAAPAKVKAAIRAGNRIAKKPYKWGGGHARLTDTGYDCSGSVSYALAAAGLLDTTLVSGQFAKWGEPGPGRWVTIYANDGHAFMTVAGLRFDTSGRRQTGTRWQAAGRGTGGFTARHPPGL
jgi:cell wall-associated NlpC family hydrolase